MRASFVPGRPADEAGDLEEDTPAAIANVA
jgi:hypothetical protein